MSALRQKPPLKEGPSVRMGSAAVPLTGTLEFPGVGASGSPPLMLQRAGRLSGQTPL